MSARSTAAIVLVALLALGAASSGKPSRQPAYSPSLPEGAGQAVATRACLVCHSAMLITQQHKDSTAWGKTVRQMQAWGVRTTPAETDSLVLYLSTHFGPRP